MAKYYVTHSCGHEICHQLVGKHSDRERKEEWLASVPCLECKQEEDDRARDDHNQQSAKENAAAGLPSLIGTEKQVAWAETIRKDLVARLDAAEAIYPGKLAKILADREKHRHLIDQVIEKGFLSIEESFSCAVLAINRLKAETSASWWIEHREDNLGQLVFETSILCRSARINESSEAIEAFIEATVRPPEPVTETVAEIRVLNSAVEISFPEKREDFWKIIKKQLGYEWAGTCWRRNLNQVINGNPGDRAAEAGNSLLAAGFIIRLFDEDLRRTAIEASFTAECKLWVLSRTTGKYEGWFVVKWPEKNDSIYSAARKLPGSKWDSPHVVVPAVHFEEVLDFAKMYGFGLSPGAHEIVAKAQAAKDAALTAMPNTPDETSMPDTSRPDLDPSTAGDIDADLLDD